jgi:CNT family concentrative nucleoside transporter
MDFLNSYLRGILGIAVLLGICFLLSKNRKAINWRTVAVGVIGQYLLAIAILKVPFINLIFDKIASFFTAILRFTEAGSKFLFGNLIADPNTFGYIFAFQVLPTVVFFSALSAVLYYFGILQWVVRGMAWLMMRTMKISGTESLASAANVFIGQTEAPLVIRPYLEKMTRSEILCLMCGGMATIAGGVFAAYVGFLGGADEVMRLFYAKHLLTASIMSAPAAIVCSKLLLPETDRDKVAHELEFSMDVGDNLLDAISRGTTDGLKLAVNVGAMLLVFTAFVFMANEILMNTIGDWTGLNEKIKIATEARFEGLTFTYLLGLIFAPLAWVLGTPVQDILTVGQLLGEKTVLNEFVAYTDLGKLKDAQIIVNEKSIIIATYALCGFSNFASIGIQIGGIGTLAPSQRRTLTELGIYALIGGSIACFMTAAIAGMLY